MITVYTTAKSVGSANSYAWLWSTKSKKGTWGKSESTETVAEIFAIISALSKLSKYSSSDIVFKTSKQEIVKMIEQPTKSTHTAVVQLRQAIYLWKGKVKAQYVSQGSQDETQRYVVSTINTLVQKKLSKENIVPKKDMNTRIVELGQKQRNIKVMKTATPKPRKRNREVLVSFFDEEEDRSVIDKTKTFNKPVTCSSCNGVINPLTNECRCSG